MEIGEYFVIFFNTWNSQFFPLSYFKIQYASVELMVALWFFLMPYA